MTQAAQVDRAAKTQIDAGELAKRVQFGVADAEERRAQFVTELNAAIDKGTVKEGERTKIMGLYERQLKDTIDAEKIRQSTTPALTSLAIEGDNLQRSLDSGFASSLRSINSEFSILNKSTDSFGQKVTNVTMKMADMIIQALMMKNVIGPLSTALSAGVSGLFSSGLGTGAQFMQGVNSANAGVDSFFGFTPTGHRGAVIGHSASGFMSVPPSTFFSAPRYHSGTPWLGSDEVPFIGKKGEEIGWPNDLARKYGGGVHVTINSVNQARGVEVEHKVTDRGNGQISIDAMITEVGKGLAAEAGSGHGALRAVFQPKTRLIG